MTVAKHFTCLQRNVAAFNFIATLTGYAYETIPNKPIIAGKTKGSDVIAAPDIGKASLGHLARGAAQK